jgi:peptidoglycan/LPS O-acetylase OafA/YrhL
MSRITALDGWRGIAILLVLVDHVQDSIVHRYPWPWTRTGQHGVTIFIVLSGFLITSKLLQGPIHLREFYIRRFFRLMPVAWTYLAVIFLLGLAFQPHLVSGAEIRACLLFYRNFVSPSGPGLSRHFWSLSLEEQFYLVWPFVLMLGGRRRSRWIAIAGAIACAAFRWRFWAHFDHNVINGQSEVRGDAILVGCLLALLLDDARFRAGAARLSRLWTLPAAVVLLYCVFAFQWLPPLTECAAIACLIASTVLHPGSVVARFLSFKPMAVLGLVSYSVYVWQELFMGFRNVYALAIGLPLAVFASYYWIERPCNRLGHRLTTAHAPMGSAGHHPKQGVLNPQQEPTEAREVR